MDASYLVTDDQLKDNVSNVMQQQLQELAIRESRPMRDTDYVEFIERNTGVLYPVTTWQQYRKGLRMRLPFLLLMSYLFKRPLAAFLGADIARKDYRLAAEANSFVLCDYISGDISMTIPREVAKALNLDAATARVLQVTKNNNASAELRFGSLAIIDTSYTKPSLSGSYLIQKDGKPVFAGITTNATSSDITLHFGEKAEPISAAELSKLTILGRVVTTLG